ncbi:hypothetical protein [Shimia sp.]|uniref:hypothetical protein n=1 Tax=Shimia sp. TaxID=1954381 RepID=UPI003BAD6573
MLDAKHNNPPDPIDEALAPYSDAIEEAQNWLDGEPVQTEDQMKAVDALLKQIRTAGTDLAKAEKSETAPLHDAWKAEKARWKPTIDDIARIKTGLTALVGDFKKELAAKKEEEKRATYTEAQRLEREAQEKAASAVDGDLESQREADAAKEQAMQAQKNASAANKDTVKGMRTVQKHEITDHKAALHWIARNDRDAVTAFIDGYVAKNFKTAPIDGVKTWSEKEAY